MTENFVETKIKTKKVTTDFNEVDDKTQERFVDVNKKATEALFDNSHDSNKIQKAIDEVETTKKREFDTFNPFYGDKDALHKLKKYSYNEVVEKKEENVNLEIKEEIVPAKAISPSPKSKRKKLWFITAIICFVLFVGLFGYNMISINSLAKKTISTQHKISEMEQTIELSNQGYEQLINSSVLLEEMKEVDTSNGDTIDLSPKNTDPKYVEKTSAWDKVCNFFAGLFGK